MKKLLLPVSRNFRDPTFVSTCLLISLALRINAIKINKNNRKIFEPVVYLINSGSPTDTKINTNNNSSPKFTDGNNANNKAFNEWLAGLIDGDGCFQLSKKGYSSLEIVMELRDKHCLYQIKDKFGGSVKLRAGNNHLRYRLHHKTGMLNLIHSINGLIRNPARILQLGKICDNYGIKLIDPKPLTVGLLDFLILMEVFIWMINLVNYLLLHLRKIDLY